MTTTTAVSPVSRGIWAETAHLFRQKILLILLIVFGFLALDIYEQLTGKSSGSAVVTIAWSLLAISVHETILHGTENVFPKAKGVFAPFLWRTFALAIPGFAISLLVFTMMGASNNLAVLVALLTYGSVTAIVLSLVGTWLPAVVADSGDRSFSAALKRGRSTFSYTLGRLIAGCGTIFVGAFAGLFALATLALHLGWDGQTLGTVSPLRLAILAVSALAAAFAFVMVPVVLSRAYLRAEQSDS